MLRSSNPILSKQDAFTPAAPQYGQTPYGQGQYREALGGYQQVPPPAPVQAPEGRMTFDDVVTKTAVTMAVLILTAAAAWFALPDALMFPALVLSGLVGFVVVLVVAFRRVINPTLVLVYAAIEGVFIGMISKIFNDQFAGIVVQAVFATFVAAGVTLAAYKFFNIRVTAKFQKVVVISTLAFAALAWNFIPQSLALPALIGSALVGFVVVLLVSFRRVVSPGLVVLYAAIEGVFIGMISKVFESVYTGIVAQAVVATFVAAGITLAAYKFFNIRVTAKFTKIVFISTAAFAGLMLVNFIFSLVTGSGGLRSGITGPVSGLSILVSAVAIVLAVLNLVLDFDYVERGIEMGAPANESWRAAFGLTVTMVWLYIEMLRLISYIRR